MEPPPPAFAEEGLALDVGFLGEGLLALRERQVGPGELAGVVKVDDDLIGVAVDRPAQHLELGIRDGTGFVDVDGGVRGQAGELLDELRPRQPDGRGTGRDGNRVDGGVDAVARLVGGDIAGLVGALVEHRHAHATTEVAELVQRRQPVVQGELVAGERAPGRGRGPRGGTGPRARGRGSADLPGPGRPRPGRPAAGGDGGRGAVGLRVEVVEAEHAGDQRRDAGGEPRRRRVGVRYPAARQPVSGQADAEGPFRLGGRRGDRDVEPVRRSGTGRQPGRRQGRAHLGDLGQGGAEERSELSRREVPAEGRRAPVGQPVQPRGQRGLVPDLQRDVQAKRRARGHHPEPPRAERQAGRGARRQRDKRPGPGRPGPPRRERPPRARRAARPWPPQ